MSTTEDGYNWEDDLKVGKFVGEVLFEGTNMEFGHRNNVSNEQLGLLISMFHAEEVHLHTEDDEWWMGIRANHFAVEIGTTEVSLEELGLIKYQEELGIKEYMNYLDDGTLEGESPQFCIVTGNQKGARMFTVWLLADTMKIKGQTGIAHEETV